MSLRLTWGGMVVPLGVLAAADHVGEPLLDVPGGGDLRAFWSVLLT